jgi:hypothetical protein
LTLCTPVAPLPWKLSPGLTKVRGLWIAYESG